MKQPDRILTLLEPPPGGLERLRTRRDSTSRWALSWSALAAGGAAAAAWLAIASEHPQIRMPMIGARLIGARSQGVGVQILENGRAVPLPSADPDVRIYWVEPTGPASAKVR
jgi:hypothetical protein